MFSIFADTARSLRFRLAALFTLCCLATVIASSGFLYFAFRHEINLRNQTLLEGRLEDVAKGLERQRTSGESFEEEIFGDYPMTSGPSMWISVTRGDEVLVASPGMSERLAGHPSLERHHGHHGPPRYLTAERATGEYRILGLLDITEDQRMIHAYRRRLLLTLLVGGGACALLGWWAAHRGLRPLQEIAQATGAITARRLRHRLVAGQVPQELRELVQALNAMLDRLDYAFERLSRFSADLAHELRTPIANLMGEAEVALSLERPPAEYREVLVSSLEEFRRLTSLISRLLFLARAEDPAAAIQAAPLPARALLDGVLGFFEAAAAEQGVRLEGTAEGTLYGDPELLRQALANLVANALAATPAGGLVRLDLEARDGHCALSVQDTGRGIPAAELDHVLDRFYRTAASFESKGSGTGLGLAIVQSVAQLHGGTVTVKSREGEGTTVAIRFPEPGTP
jgi:two-component system heavy metal sensor histidine kinase CusS